MRIIPGIILMGLDTDICLLWSDRARDYGSFSCPWVPYIVIMPGFLFSFVLFSYWNPIIPFGVGSQLKRSEYVCMCAWWWPQCLCRTPKRKSCFGQVGKVTPLLVELLKRWNWLSFFHFFLPSSCASCQHVWPSHATVKNECIRTHCPKSSNVLTAKTSPVQALVIIHEVFLCGA